MRKNILVIKILRALNTYIGPHTVVFYGTPTLFIAIKIE